MRPLICSALCRLPGKRGKLMCGVFGYVGRSCDVGGSVVAALKLLEYRGYDSWGLAIGTANGLIVDKDVGRLNGHVSTYPESTIGLGHTRWATHGGVTSENAHPHTDCTKHIAVVHNGIIENHAVLRKELEARGHRFGSQTDSEVVAHLVEERLSPRCPLPQAVAEVFQLLEGCNAIVVMDARSATLVAAKRTSPLVVGQSLDRSTVASDAIALDHHANELIYLEDGQVAVLTAAAVDILDLTSLQPTTPFRVHANPTRDDTSLNGHPDFLSKEVSEQPAVLRLIIERGAHDVAALATEIRSASRIVLVGCGSAGNAALAGTYFFSEIAATDAVFVPASEYQYRAATWGPGTLVIALSQSGETLDVIEAVSDAKRRGARLAAIVNTPNSTLERMVDCRVLIGAGLEQCVLATKSYTAMLATLLLTASAVSDRWSEGAKSVATAAAAIENVLNPRSYAAIVEIGRHCATVNHLFAIGRAVHYPSALEAALKIKEVSYIHAEGFAAGELKHGVIALIERGTPCLVFAPDDDTRTDMISSASELRSRGGFMIGIGSTSDPVFDEFIPVQDAGIASSLVEAVPGQLLGYAAACARGHDPDRPRNLAKSVTVK